MQVKLKRFMTPNFVRAEDKSDMYWPLSDLAPSVLSDLCDDFRREVFRKAGRVDPRGT